MSKIFKWMGGLFVVMVLVVAGYAWVRGKARAETGPRTVEARIGSITEKAVASGRIEPRLKYSVKSKISGNVKRCAVEIGDRVQAGDPLFEIVPDPTPAERLEAERAVESARTAFERAEADWNRIRELHVAGVVSRGEHDARWEAYEQARIALQEAGDRRDLLEHGRIEGGGAGMESILRAPAAGTVLERTVNPGDPVVPLTSYQAGTELATIADMGDLVFKGTVDEIDVGRLAAGLPARIKVGALPASAVTGTLMRIAPQAREAQGVRLFDVEIELDPVTGAELRAGYSANADLVVQSKKDVLVIPERVVQFEDEGRKAFVEVPGTSPDAPPRRVEIKTGLSDGLQIEITEGLKAGDKIIEPAPKEIAQPF